MIFKLNNASKTIGGQSVDTDQGRNKAADSGIQPPTPRN